MSDKQHDPMDPNVQEVSPAEAVIKHTPRMCYAARTLVEEMAKLFPEIMPEPCATNGRGVALGVRFMLDKIEDRDRRLAARELIKALEVGIRVSETAIETGEDYGEEYGSVYFRSNARTQDDPSPFHLREAFAILTGDEA
jgi:hypothetical protein